MNYRLQTEPPGWMATHQYGFKQAAMIWHSLVLCHRSLYTGTALEAKQTTFCLNASQRTSSQRARVSQAPGDQVSKDNARNCTSPSSLLWLRRWEPASTSRVAFTTTQTGDVLTPSLSDHAFCTESNTRMGTLWVMCSRWDITFARCGCQWSQQCRCISFFCLIVIIPAFSQLWGNSSCQNPQY